MHSVQEKSKEKKLNTFKDVCKQHNIKLTPQRLIIYETLLDHPEHPSTDMVYQCVRKTFPTISFDTVNRTLLTLHELGVANIIEGTGNPKRYDGNVVKHHHFQCVKCKRIIDVFYTEYNSLPIPQDIQEKHRVQDITVRLQGVCDQCRDRSGK